MESAMANLEKLEKKCKCFLKENKKLRFNFKKALNIRWSFM